MPLDDERISSVNHGNKSFKLYEERGLLLLVMQTGRSKWWRWNYHFGGRKDRFSLAFSQTYGLLPRGSAATTSAYYLLRALTQASRPRQIEPVTRGIWQLPNFNCMTTGRSPYELVVTA